MKVDLRILAHLPDVLPGKEPKLDKPGIRALRRDRLPCPNNQMLAESPRQQLRNTP